MRCQKCKVQMVPGVAMVPVWGSNSRVEIARGNTIYEVTSVLGPVDKCPSCGYSVGPRLLRMTRFPERIVQTDVLWNPVTEEGR